MNTPTTTAILIIALSLLGCSTPQPEPESVEVAPTPVAQLTPLPNVQALPPGTPRFESRQFELPLEPDDITKGRLCQLGTSCLALDSRPFEPCLVGTKHCSDKVREPIDVRGPVVPDNGVQEVSTHETGDAKE
jgi:hypothetical protein